VVDGSGLLPEPGRASCLFLDALPSGHFYLAYSAGHATARPPPQAASSTVTYCTTLPFTFVYFPNRFTLADPATWPCQDATPRYPVLQTVTACNDHVTGWALLPATGSFGVGLGPPATRATLYRFACRTRRHRCLHALFWLNDDRLAGTTVRIPQKNTAGSGTCRPPSNSYRLPYALLACGHAPFTCAPLGVRCTRDAPPRNTTPPTATQALPPTTTLHTGRTQ